MFFRGAPLTDIGKAATWTHPLTLVSQYRLHVPTHSDASFGQALPAPVLTWYPCHWLSQINSITVYESQTKKEDRLLTCNCSTSSSHPWNHTTHPIPYSPSHIVLNLNLEELLFKFRGAIVACLLMREWGEGGVLARNQSALVHCEGYSVSRWNIQLCMFTKMTTRFYVYFQIFGSKNS